MPKPHLHGVLSQQITRVHVPISLGRNLSLARTSSWATRAGCRRGSMSIGVPIQLARDDLPVCQCCNIRKLGVFERSSCLSACRTLSILLVRCKVERDEEDEVGADYSHSGESGELLACTVSSIGHPFEVGRGEVGVRCKVYKSCFCVSYCQGKILPHAQHGFHGNGPGFTNACPRKPHGTGRKSVRTYQDQ
jgi:hypothetical protein